MPQRFLSAARGALRRWLRRDFDYRTAYRRADLGRDHWTIVGPATREEHEAFMRLIADRRVGTVRGIGSMIGRGVSATFPALAGLAALAVQRKAFFRPFEADEIEAQPPALSGRIVVTSVGMSCGEGMGLITAVT